VAGLASAQHLAREFDIPLVVATDMGGTSFDIGIMQATGTFIYDFQPVIDRWLVSTPMVYLRTLGAGGGSIARYDRLWRTVEVGRSRPVRIRDPRATVARHAAHGQ